MLEHASLLGPALLGLAIVAVVLIGRMARHRGVFKRPILLIALICSTLPMFYVGLIWVGLLPERFVRFGRPELTVLVFAAMAFSALRLANHQARQSRKRLALSDLFISLTVLGCSLAAAEPELGRPLDRLTVIAVIDRSRSIDLVPNAEARISRELKAAEASMKKSDRIGTVVFGADASTEDPPRPRTELASPQRAEIARDGSNLAAGLRRALAELPADSAARLVLLSDGVATRGDLMAASAAAVASDVPIDVIPLEQRELPDIRVVSFHASPRANKDETINMRLAVASPEAADVEVRLKRDGVLIQRLAGKVLAGEDVIRLRDKAADSGLHRYDVEISAVDPRLDTSADDNVGSAFVRVRGRSRALVLDGDADQTAFIGQSLRAAGFDVQEGTQSSLPRDIDGMAAYDLIAFGDIPAHHLAPSQIDDLASYVRDLGGGLLLTGGDRSMGPGGYALTPLEEISPVSFDLKQEKRRASLAQVIGIDISGSMSATAGRHTKLELANEGAARSAALLGAGDMLGVIHVDTAAHWSVSLQAVTDKKAIDTAIRGVKAGGGGIYVDIALREAYAALRPVSVNLKHTLLFADGSDAEHITPAVKGQVSAAMRNDGITTSCVSLGRGSDSAALEELSRLGGGRYYIVEDATRLPAIFAQETILASRSAIVEKPFRVAQAGSGSAIRGIEVAQAPTLAGYVVTIPKARSSVLLSGPENDPILATWSAGLGQAAAFTSDLKSRWGESWTHWEGAARIVAQTARHIARSQDDARVRLQAEISGGRLNLRATVVDDDGRAESFRRLVVTVRGPGGFHQELPLEAASAGSYLANLPLSRPGAYVAVARDEVGQTAVATTGAVLSTGEELRPTGSDLALLNRVAEITGGQRRDTLAGIFNDRGRRRFSYQSAALALLLAAAFALLFAVAARRLSVPEAVLAWLQRVQSWRPWAYQPEGAPAPGGATAGSTLSALLERRRQDKPEPTTKASDDTKGTVDHSPIPREPSSPIAASSTAPPVPRAITPVSDPERPPASQRSLTAAEILLERRRRKRS